MAIALFLTSSPVMAQQSYRKHQLLRLQSQANSLINSSAESKKRLTQLLTLVTGTLLLTQTKHLSQQQFKTALAQQVQDIKAARLSRTPSALPELSSRFMMAKKAKPTADPSQLSLFPDEAPAKAPAASPNKDLSWLDEAPPQLKPTKIHDENFLFSDPQFQSKRPKSAFAQKVEREHMGLACWEKLTQEERAGLIQRLNQAAAIRCKHGREAAQKFLFDMGQKYERARIIFFRARNMLWGVGLLLVANELLTHSQEDAFFARLVQNPQLFLNASEEEIEVLAQHEESVSYAELIVTSLEELSNIPLTQEDEKMIQELLRHEHVISQPSLQKLHTF